MIGAWSKMFNCDCKGSDYEKGINHGAMRSKVSPGIFLSIRRRFATTLYQYNAVNGIFTSLWLFLLFWLKCPSEPYDLPTGLLKVTESLAGTVAERN
jgi:hypothetical protein